MSLLVWLQGTCGIIVGEQTCSVSVIFSALLNHTDENKKNVDPTEEKPKVEFKFTRWPIFYVQNRPIQSNYVVSDSFLNHSQPGAGS